MTILGNRLLCVYIFFLCISDAHLLSDVLQQFYDLKVVKYELLEMLASSISDLQEKDKIEELLKHGVSICS